MRRVARALAIFGIATAGVLTPLGAATDAGTATEATASPEIGTAAVRYGGYRDLGTSNYWKNAVRAAGYRTSNCSYRLERQAVRSNQNGHASPEAASQRPHRP